MHGPDEAGLSVTSKLHQIRGRSLHARAEAGPGAGAVHDSRPAGLMPEALCRSFRVEAVARGRLRDTPGVPSPESVRRRQSGVLVVGAVEPEVTPWLRAAGHAPRAVRDAAAA